MFASPRQEIVVSLCWFQDKLVDEKDYDEDQNLKAKESFVSILQDQRRDRTHPPIGAD